MQLRKAFPLFNINARYNIMNWLFLLVSTVYLFVPEAQPQNEKHGSTSLSPRPVTVADIIETTVFGTRPNTHAGLEDVWFWSPDGMQVAVVVYRGNIARNTRDFTLMVFQTAKLLRKPKPDTVVMLSSSTNRPAISKVQWLGDNKTLAFLGERPGELPQVFTVNTITGALTQRTHAKTVIRRYGISQTGNRIVYSAGVEYDVGDREREAMLAHGLILDPEAGGVLSDLRKGRWDDVDIVYGKRNKNPNEGLWMVLGEGLDARLPLPDSAAGVQGCDLESLSVVPSGDAMWLLCRPTVMPSIWREYRVNNFIWRNSNEAMEWQWYSYVLDTRQVRPVSGTPHGKGSSLYWAPDGRSVLVTYAVLPLDGVDLAEREIRATHSYVLQVGLYDGTVRKVVDAQDIDLGNPPLRFWDSTNTLEYGVENRKGWTGRNKGLAGIKFIRNTLEGWRQVPISATKRPILQIEEGPNAPFKLVAIDPRTLKRHLVFDPNPGLLRRFRFGKVTYEKWKYNEEDVGTGMLYWPVDYVAGRRYPLVIQGHGGVDTTAWLPDGFSQDVFAAQPLAAAGIFVIQITPAGKFVPGMGVDTYIKESVQNRLESLIDYLDRRGLIDRSRIGMSGYSSDTRKMLFFMLRSKYPIVAASFGEGCETYSYWQSIETGLRKSLCFNEGMSLASEPNYSPWGKTRARWIENSPGFNLDRVTAMIRFLHMGTTDAPGLLMKTDYEPGSVFLHHWEYYQGLLFLGTPTEYEWQPRASHLRTRPWDRFTSQQRSTVDWLRYWLQGYERTKPITEAEETVEQLKAQYERWGKYRAQRDAKASRR